MLQGAQLPFDWRGPERLAQDVETIPAILTPTEAATSES